MTTMMSPRMYAGLVAVDLEQKAEALEALPELTREDALCVEVYRTAIKHIEDDPNDRRDYVRARNAEELGLLAERAETHQDYDTVASCLSLLRYTDHEYGVDDIVITVEAMYENGWAAVPEVIAIDHVVACKKLRDYELYGHPERLYNPIAGAGPTWEDIAKLKAEAEGHICLSGEVQKDLMNLLMDLPTAIDDVLTLASKGTFKTSKDIWNSSVVANADRYMSMPLRYGARKSLWTKPGKDGR